MQTCPHKQVYGSMVFASSLFYHTGKCAQNGQLEGLCTFSLGEKFHCQQKQMTSQMKNTS